MHLLPNLVLWMNLLLRYGIVKAVATGANTDRDEPVRQRSLRDAQPRAGAAPGREQPEPGVAGRPRRRDRPDQGDRVRSGRRAARRAACWPRWTRRRAPELVDLRSRTDPDSQGAGGLGLEVNVDYLAACLLDLTGAERHLEIRRGDQRGRPPGRVLADLAAFAAEMVRAATAKACAWAGSPWRAGLVDGRTGPTRPNLGWRGGGRLADSHSTHPARLYWRWRGR